MSASATPAASRELPEISPPFLPPSSTGKSVADLSSVPPPSTRTWHRNASHHKWKWTRKISLSLSVSLSVSARSVGMAMLGRGRCYGRPRPILLGAIVVFGLARFSATRLHLSLARSRFQRAISPLSNPFGLLHAA